MAYAVDMRTAIQQCREEAGLTRRQLAELCDTSETQIYRLEMYDTDDPDNKNTREPTWSWMLKIAEALGVTPADLVSNAAGASLVDEVTEALVAAPLQSRSIHTYRVIRTSLDDVPYVQPGEIIYVDESPAAIADKKSDDVLLVRMAHADGKGKPVRMLWQFHAPAILMTNRRRSNLAIRLDDPRLKIDLLGVVLGN
jgi:DNA-binding XRE family transcriptional regulator